MMRWRHAIFIVMAILMIGAVSGAQWVDDPANCAIVKNAISDPLGGKLCGFSGGVAYWYDTDSLAAPAPSTTYSTTQGGFSGFVLDCESKSGSEPFCLNSAKCVRDSTCQAVGRLTECSDWGVSSCSTCGPGRQYCDGSFTDADGCEITVGVTTYPGEANAVYSAACGPQCSTSHLDCNANLGAAADGCEIQKNISPFGVANAHYGTTCTQAVCDSGWMACEGDSADIQGCNTQVGSSCTTGDGKPGTWQNGCLCQELSQEDLITNTESKGWGDYLVSARQMNPAGWLMKLVGDNGANFSIDDFGCIVFSDGSKQCSAGVGAESGENGTSIMGENGSVSVGIGTESPRAELDVNGTGLFTYLGDIINRIENIFTKSIDTNNITLSGSSIDSWENLSSWYVKDSGDNVTGRYNFDGDWNSGGVTIDDGEIFAQRLYVYNVTSLKIDHLNVNGSIIPEGFDSSFDIGSNESQWRNLYVSDDIVINGSSLKDALVSGAGVGTIIGMTNQTFTGRITSGSLVGYTAANYICSQLFIGSHFCMNAEILSTIASGDYFYSGDYWFSNGPPGFTANANDCNGWTDSTGDYLGPFWKWEANAQAGAAFLTPCTQSIPLMCCK